MTNEQLLHCLEALPPEVRNRFLERADAFRKYLRKAGTVRAKLSSDFPEVDARVAAFVSLAIARFL
ncbi:MAG: hypothetical protein ABIQ16_05955 [Polyangiaceae bacterium]